VCRLGGKRDINIEWAIVSVWPGDVLQSCPLAAPTADWCTSMVFFFAFWFVPV
jgi:hypothetical protein